MMAYLAPMMNAAIWVVMFFYGIWTHDVFAICSGAGMAVVTISGLMSQD